MDRAAEVLIEHVHERCQERRRRQALLASVANHMDSADHVKGIRTATDLTPQVLSLSTNVELLTAIANDIGYSDVFTYQLQSKLVPGDVLIAVSSSGRSRNIVDAIAWARDNGLRTIAITGFNGVWRAPPLRSRSMWTARTTALWKTCTRRSCTRSPS